MKTQESQNSITPRVFKEPGNEGTAQLVDNRTATIDQRKLQKTMNTSTENSAKPIQQKANKTGLPDNLKSGIENLSGYSMDDVKVHYNSSKPAQLQAHAYAQGTDIHLAPGQEKHLPHEAWHVVQQKQDRVKPTKQLKSKVNINDDAGLEKEADVMGQKALQLKSQNIHKQHHYDHKTSSSQTIQRQKVDPNRLNVIGETHGALNVEDEKEFVEEKFGNKNRYWEEFNFYAKPLNKPNVVEGGESILIRFVWDFKRELAKETNKNKKPEEILFNLMSFQGLIFYQKELKTVIDHNANNEGELAKALLKIIKDANTADKAVNTDEDTHTSDNDMNILMPSKKYLENRKKIRLYSEYSVLEPKIINYWKSHPYFSNSGFNKLLDFKDKLPAAISNDLVKARSVIMYQHAYRYQKIKGIWKIGQNHVNDIRNWYPEDNRLPFNLINQKDWTMEFKTWCNSKTKTGNLDNEDPEV